MVFSLWVLAFGALSSQPQIASSAHQRPKTKFIKPSKQKQDTHVNQLLDHYHLNHTNNDRNYWRPWLHRKFPCYLPQ